MLDRGGCRSPAGERRVRTVHALGSTSTATAAPAAKRGQAPERLDRA